MGHGVYTQTTLFPHQAGILFSGPPCSHGEKKRNQLTVKCCSSQTDAVAHISITLCFY